MCYTQIKHTTKDDLLKMTKKSNCFFSSWLNENQSTKLTFIYNVASTFEQFPVGSEDNFDKEMLSSISLVKHLM